MEQRHILECGGLTPPFCVALCSGATVRRAAQQQGCVKPQHSKEFDA
jgi:hypothetical protein